MKISIRNILLASAFMNSLMGSVSVRAEDSNSVKITGQFRLREEGDDRTDFTGNRGYGLLRLRPVVDFTRDPNLNIVFTPQFARTLGEPIYTIPANTGTPAKQGTSGSTTDPNFSVHEAYADYHTDEHFAFRGGRMALSYGDEWVIGALEWNNVARSFDGLRTRFTYPWGTSDLFAMKITDNNTLAQGAGDVNFYGFYNSFDLGDLAHKSDFYLLDQHDGTSISSTDLSAVGIRLASQIGIVDYKTEFTQEFGSALGGSKNGYQFHIEAGATLDGAIKPRFAAEYFVAGMAYNQLYPTSHGWLGIADTLQRKNLTGFDIAANAQVAPGLLAKAKYYAFSRLNSSASAFKYNGAALGTSDGSSSNAIGSEWDLLLNYSASKTITFTGGAAVFKNGAYLKDQGFAGTPSFYYLQMEAAL